jgi:hypothetical protein
MKYTKLRRYLKESLTISHLHFKYQQNTRNNDPYRNNYGMNRDKPKTTPCLGSVGAEQPLLGRQTLQEERKTHLVSNTVVMFSSSINLTSS